jgi:hypothetical protein
MRQLGHYGFRFAPRLGIAGPVGKANDIVGVGDVNPLRIISAREKSDPEGLFQAARVNLVDRRL